MAVPLVLLDSLCVLAPVLEQRPSQLPVDNL